MLNSFSRRFALTFSVICLVGMISDVNAAPPEGFDFTKIPANALYEEGELLVRFAPKANKSHRSKIERKQILNSLGGAKLTHNYKIVPGLSLVKLPPGQTTKEALKIYNNTEGILHAQPNYELYAFTTEPNDIYFNDLWSMHNTGQSHPVEGGGTSSGTPDADIDAPEAWDIITDANDIIVAVIDTGVDYTHPDLAANMWKTIEEPNDANNDGYPGIQGVDDDGDGLIDEDSGDFEPGDPNWTNDLFEDDDENGYANDIYGYDFCTKYGKFADPDPNDDRYHGTHCAGTIGAVGNNSLGVTGVCWKVKIMALKFLAYNGSGNTADAIKCIEYAVANGAKILNNSWGGGPKDDDLETAIENARKAGVLFIAAAGNYNPGNPYDLHDTDDLPIYPSCYDLDNIISVMATDHNDNVPDFSKYGKYSVDLAAPGQDILSTFPTFESDAMDLYGYSTYYETISGTSMAAPHVAGACALVWAQHPDWNWQMVKGTILNSVDKLAVLDNKCVSEGRLNLHKALTSKPPFLSITKTDDFHDPNDCGVEPNDLVTYTIDYANPQEDPNAADYLGTTYNVEITDYLPAGTYLNLADPNYDFFDGEICTWFIEELDPGDAGTITISVWVNEGAEPSGEIENLVTIESENAYKEITEKTPVCCWDEPGIIYVKQDAYSGTNAGTSWDNAYTDLYSALERVGRGCGTEIWVAEGTYSPVASDDETFNLIDGVALYGGFAGNETSREQRNWTANPTVLTGYGNCNAIVTADELNFAVLDGFIIQYADQYGIQCTDSNPHIAHCLIRFNGEDGMDCYLSDPNISHCTIAYNDRYGIACDESNPDITNCLIKNNYNHGIYCDDSDPNVFHSILRHNAADGLYAQSTSAPLLYECLIETNGSDGIECKGNDSYLIVTNCKIRTNEEHGIYLNDAEEGVILNNWIHHNQQDGIRIYSCDSVPTIRNNTIVYNADYGIEYSQGSAPIVKNNILWGNETQLSVTLSPTYCCIEGVTMPNGNNNIDNYPEFAYPDPDSYNFHLDPNSACIDVGDTTGIDPNETDIDGDERIFNSDVDIGADEVACTDVSHEADFNGDGIINLLDYAPLAAYWLTDDSDPNWPDEYDLIDDKIINLLDLHAFCNDWLWTACYYSDNWYYTMEWMMYPGAGFGQFFSMQSQSEITAPPPVEITAEQLAELIEDLKKLWEKDEEFRKEVGEEAWKKTLEMLYEELARLSAH